MRKRIFLTAVVLTAAILGLVVFRRFTVHTDAQESEDWSHVIAYVPLDDRTDNLEDMIHLAEASGYRIILPERDLFRTALDGQPLNRNGTQYGDRGALLEWLREMNAAGCHCFILSLDQLFSGGLVNSRAISVSQMIPLSDGSSMREADIFDAWILPLADDPQNRVYLFDSLTRLSPTVGYQGLGEAEYFALREYAMVPRPGLSGERLTLENIFALYPYAEDGATRAEDVLENDSSRSVLTEEILETYLGVRRRKLTLLENVISALLSTPRGNIQLIVGIDDSSNSVNIQSNEIRYLQARLGVPLMAGLDSLARLLVGRIAQEEYDYHVRASVRYIGGSQAQPSSEFDRYTLEEVADLHMDFFRAQRVPETEAELQILIMTAPDDPEKADAYCEELLSALEYNLAHHIPTVLDEASNNAYGDALDQALLSRVRFAGLVAYAGKYDQANVTGAAFAMGFSRYLYLRCRTDKEDPEETCTLAQVRQMATSMALTEYILHTRVPLNRYVNQLGLHYQNMLLDGTREEQILRKLETLLRPDCRRVSENLQGDMLLTSLEPYEERRIQEVLITEFYFPWSRTFELAFTVFAALEPQENTHD